MKIFHTFDSKTYIHMLTTALCAIARHEEDYLAEWIDYHLALGFDHIFIYDNDDPRDDAITQLCRHET